jgi:uncharacterized metal-binding protein YceD (DUF177 family)
MKKNVDIFEINLRNLKPDGETFEYDTQVEPGLQSKIRDLTGQNNTVVKIELLPIGNAFQVRGSIKANLPLECSRCGTDMSLPLDLNVNEILIIEEKRPRGSQQTKNQESERWTSEGPFCNYLESYIFDLAEYIHEQIASNTPYITECGTVDCENLTHSSISSSNMEEYQQDANPFEILRNFSTKQ